MRARFTCTRSDNGTIELTPATGDTESASFWGPVAGAGSIKINITNNPVGGAATATNPQANVDPGHAPKNAAADFEAGQDYIVDFSKAGAKAEPRATEHRPGDVRPADAVKAPPGSIVGGHPPETDKERQAREVREAKERAHDFPGGHHAK
jgi:hypothetical protein